MDNHGRYCWGLLSAAILFSAPVLPALADPPAAAPIAAAGPDLQAVLQEGDVDLPEFTFRNGEHLSPLHLHYSTLGKPQRDAAGKITNAILLLHATTGTGKTFLVPTIAHHLFGPGQPLDPQRYYIVLPDGIGFGGSTKPSDGLHGRFPHYGYRDQVAAQHAMLEAMGIDHLKLVAGISQGGMQAWLWAEQFPDAMDGVMPIACMPMQISGRNLMWRQIVSDAVRSDPKWNGGEYDRADPPTAWTRSAALMFALMVSTPDRLQAAGPDRAKTLAYEDELSAQYRGRDAGDALYDYESSADYDPAPDVARIKAPMLAINFADDQVNPAQLPVARETIARLPAGRFVLLPGGWGHAGIYHADLWADQLGTFLSNLSVQDTQHLPEAASR
ncbi:alpha/beta fold hydrolase [Methylobacterium sp. J-077]|uniref:alpha/beta fold hydrolase n=1 Tax=Methylobacterium sp. J-077 TaxID=2836656 RepID=UPI002444BDFA|nr:alpha/beta fold hydrolase [Methylobacterium sp. J-077]